MNGALFLAEISDKVPDVTGTWIFAILFGGVACLAARWRAWTVGVAWTVPLVFLAAWVSELCDPSWREAVLHELGVGYLAHMLCVSWFMFAAPALGVIWSRFAWRTASVDEDE